MRAEAPQVGVRSSVGATVESEPQAALVTTRKANARGYLMRMYERHGCRRTPWPSRWAVGTPPRMSRNDTMRSGPSGRRYAEDPSALEHFGQERPASPGRPGRA